MDPLCTRLAAFPLACFIAGLLAGCGSKDPDAAPVDAQPMVAAVQQAVTNSIASAQQATGGAGSMALELNGPFAPSGCYLELGNVTGRMPLLRITSYNDPTNESFPSIMLYSPLDASATTPESLLNKKVEFQVFAVREAEGPVYSTLPGESVLVTFTAFADNTLTGQIEPGSTLSDTATRMAAPISGTFTASVKN